MGAQTGLFFVWHINNEPCYFNQTPGELKLTYIAYGVVNDPVLSQFLYMSSLSNTQYAYLNKGDTLDLRCQSITAGPRTINMNNNIIKIKKIN